MPNELPPETAEQLIRAHLDEARRAVEVRGWVASSDSPAFQAWWDAGCPGCGRPEVLATVKVDDDGIGHEDDIAERLWPRLIVAVAVGGFGMYDYLERAGWVKREEPKPVAEPEEWGERVKLAVVGERPDGLLDDERVELQDDDGHTIAIRARGRWATAAHYRRKRIRAVYEQGEPGHFGVIWGESRTPISMAPGHYTLRDTTWTPATTPEVTAAKAGRDPNGVVSWAGGECPEGADGTSGAVYAHYRSGGLHRWAGYPNKLDWRHTEDSDHDIIAYEVTG